MKRSRQRNIWRRTLENKIIAILLLLIGIVPALIDRDSTGTIFLAIIAIPLFFAKENWII